MIRLTCFKFSSNWNKDEDLLSSNGIHSFLTSFKNSSSYSHIELELKGEGGLAELTPICSRIGRWSERPPIATHELKRSNPESMFSDTKKRSSRLPIATSPAWRFLHVGTSFIGSESIEHSFSKKVTKKSLRGSGLALLFQISRVDIVRLRSPPRIVNGLPIILEFDNSF